MFYIACVLYNKKIREIGSINQFLRLKDEHEDVRLVLFDNSVSSIAEENLHQSTETFVQIQYIPNDGNIGLSKAYNKMLRMAGTEDWLFWTDDDTSFSYEYLENVYQETRSSISPVIAGVVKTQAGSILSPILADDKAPVSSEGLVRNVYCINSGLCVKRDVYDRIGFYDDKLFLDMIDYWLFDEMRKQGIDEVFIVSGDITQSFSGKVNTGIRPMLKRFIIYRKDFRAYCELEGKSHFYRGKILARRFLNILFQGIMKRN